LIIRVTGLSALDQLAVGQDLPGGGEFNEQRIQQSGELDIQQCTGHGAFL
jgi:hypothetical protein